MECIHITALAQYSEPDASAIREAPSASNENACGCAQAGRKDGRTEIILIGLNHKTAEIELRECLGFSTDDAGTAMFALRDRAVIREIIILSTCNRMEIILSSPQPDDAIQRVLRYLSVCRQMPVPRFQDALYIHRGDAAVRHLFRVAASLDSMVVGEPQILGQIKAAYRMASQKSASGVILNRLLHKTFSIAKKVRSETGIGDHAVSISYAAIELARKIFGSLEGRHVLLIGAGEMAELAVEHLMRHRAGNVFVANRTFERAVDLAGRFRGQAIRFEEIATHLELADIIISSTGSPDYILRKDQVKKVLRPRKNRPLFFIDIAVPRDIHPDINRLPNVYVYDIDDLKDVIEENIEDREREAQKAERLIEEAVIKFRQWYDSLDVVPTIVALRQKLSRIAEAEVNKTLHQYLGHLSPGDAMAIGRMTDAMVKKILHDPTLFLKRCGCYGEKAASIDLTRKIFKLDED